MARLHQRELKTLKARLANSRPARDGDESGDEAGGMFGDNDDQDNDGNDGGAGLATGNADNPAGGEGEEKDGTTRVEALTLQLHARNETIREVLKEKEELYKQVHELKMTQDKLSRTKVKYKMSQDVVAQLQTQLLTISQEVRNQLSRLLRG